MNKRLFSSLQFRLSALFVLMLLLVSGVLLYTLMSSSDMYLAESLQTANTNLAKSISKELNIDEQTNDFYDADLGRVFESAMVINPNIKLYLVHINGKAFGYSADSGYKLYGRISTQPIINFLSGAQKFPIFGDNPLDLATPQVFSASIIRTKQGDVHCYLYVILSSEKHQSMLAMVQKSYILSVLFRTVLISIAVALILGLLVIRVLTRDLRRLTGFVRAVKSGDFSARVQIHSTDEISELADAFNEMAATVESSLKQLKENDDLRRELVANISHDLRTPLASIEGYLETLLLKENLLSEEERRAYKQTILKNTRTLTRLVSQLFELSKLEAKQVEPKFEVFSVTELLYDVAMQARPVAIAKEVYFNAELPQESLFIKSDIGLIQRVVQNLIDNAIHYTNPGGTVTVGLKIIRDDIFESIAHRQQIQIFISDTGSGIADDELAHIFDRYYRSDNVRAKNRAGLGLGLAISKHILHLCGSILKVKSKIGEGTVFYFELDSYHEAYSELSN